MLVRLDTSFLDLKAPDCLPNPTFGRPINRIQLEAHRPMIANPILLTERRSLRYRKTGISDKVIKLFPQKPV